MISVEAIILQLQQNLVHILICDSLFFLHFSNDLSIQAKSKSPYLQGSVAECHIDDNTCKETDE